MAANGRFVTLRAVPYCLWDNRAAGAMAVWLREAAGDQTPPITADGFPATAAGHPGVPPNQPQSCSGGGMIAP